MKLLKLFSILILIQNCSFDNKSGIWKNENNLEKDEKSVFKDFETIKSLDKKFNQIIPIKKNYIFDLPLPIKNYKWSDIFYSENNNLVNFELQLLNSKVFQSKKISKNETNNLIMYEDNNILVSDKKGNLIVFSIDTNKIISKFNFYKNRYKKIKKSLNFIVEDNVVYISDNIGYLYAYNYKKNELLWAKNYKIPFRSNLKIKKNTLIGSNQNNNLFFFNKKNGSILKSFPTEDNVVKNEFVNNLSLNNQNVLFLNTYGSLYSIDTNQIKINWFININQSLNLNPGNLFKGKAIINNDVYSIISAENFTYIIDNNTGNIVNKKNFSSQIKPILLKKYLFLITKNNLLVSFDIKKNEIIYSYDINKKISDYLKIKKKNVNIQSMMIVNDKIFIFLKNSYLLIFNINGSLEEIKKFKSKIKSFPIIIEDSILFINDKNKLLITN